MDFVLNLVVYAVPFLILYFVIAAAVKRGIDRSEVGKMLVEKHLEKNNKK
ncbi:hypothetical protein [Oceanobacillus polygoni]|uniref:Uncharacterized protein n=1 Tax=Oceanobacillus polygoni TaxID=1235259 RepID=A0A9X0YT42_9BACI|nr:hypothetical protein [Oceanobacillus polygoni]MBP2076820.1 hypothetical protein [Oceanobacillus polygoni]